MWAGVRSSLNKLQFSDKQENLFSGFPEKMWVSHYKTHIGVTPSKAGN
jgi:hypothetical protein